MPDADIDRDRDRGDAPKAASKPVSAGATLTQTDASAPVILRPILRPIALVGLMGVGKTTVGRRLAKALELGFVDSDEEIERASGRTVAGYFRDHGEAAFRDGERRVVERLLAEPDYVIATGGGAFIHPPTHELLKAHALTIWLRGDFETIMKRVSKKDTRPLLKVADPRAKMKALMEERTPIYAKADITVDVSRGPHGRTVARVRRAIDRYAKKHGLSL